MASLRLSVFGPPRLAYHDQPIELNLRKALALVAYLAVSGQPHSRDALATLLWPESDGREGRSRLRRTLHRLTQAIGADVLDSGPETLRISAHADLWLDSAAFRQHATAGLAAAIQDVVAPQRLAHLNAAVELYTGDFLDGFSLPDSQAFDEWQFFQRESLRQLYGQVLEQLVQAYRAQQAWDQAIACALKWLALDGLHEPAHRALMSLYAWSGQHAAALRQYQECARTLDSELGVTPEDETSALYEAIRTRQLAMPAAARAVGAPPTATELGPQRQDLPKLRLADRHPALLSGQRGQSRGAEPSAPITDTPAHAAQVAQQLGRRPSPDAERLVFVAREQELARLDALLDAALAGENHVAFVVGEAGQGKTSLLQAFAWRAQQAHSDLIVAGGNCNAYTGAGDPYLPFREILELLTGDVEARALAGRLRHDQAERLWQSLPVAGQALVDVGPDLLDTFISARRLLGRAAAYAGGDADWAQQLQELATSKASRPSDPQQQNLFEQYARVLQQLAQHAPLLLILDDLQWADPGSTNLLLHLGRRLKGSQVLIVGAYRPADVAIGREGERHPLQRVIGELQRDFGEIRLDLGQAEGRRLIDALLDTEPNQLDEAFRTALYQQTGGHPLFTIELLRDLQERGALAHDHAGCWVVAPNLDWSRLPARVEGVIGERVGRLDAQLREILQVASVEGEEFTAEVLARVLGADEPEIVRQLSRELDQRHHLVRALGVRRDDGVRLSRYRFQHIVIQRYMYGSLDDIELLYQHEAVGHALEQLHGARVAEIAAQLARHFEAAQLPAKAAIYCDQAGDQARRSAASAEAIHYYQTALEQWPAPDRAGRVRLLRKLAECQWVHGQLQDALATSQACLSLCESLGDREGAAAVQRLIGRMYWEQGDRAQSLQHYHRALRLLEQGPESVELAWAISSISQMHMLASAYDWAIDWGQRALAMAERLEAEHVMVHALINIGNSYMAIGAAERGQGLVRRGWQHAVELDLAYEACRAAYMLGNRLTDVGQPAEARAVLEELRTYAVRKQVPMFACGALLSLARLDWLTGRWQSALARRHEIREWTERGQSISYLEVVASTTFAWIHNDLGQPEIAHQLLEQARSKVGGRAEIQTTGPHLGQRTRALEMLGFEAEATEAGRQFLQLIEPQRDYWDTTMPHLAVCRWFAGRAAGMRDELSASLAQLAQVDRQYSSPITAAALSEGRGLAALSEEDMPRALEQLRQAAAQWQALGHPYDQARALVALGRALAQAGEDDEASLALDQALALFETLGAQLEDTATQAAFRRSPLVRQLRHAIAALPSAA